MITINGKTYHGNNVSIIGGRVIIDGVEQKGDPLSGRVEVVVVSGMIENLRTDASVQCGAVGGNVDAGGSVDCDEVRGNVTAGGSVNCNDVGKSISAGGSVTCDDVGGSVSAGGPIRRG